MKIIVIFCMVVSLTAQAGFAASSLKITGLNGELKKNVNLYLESIPKSDYSTNVNFQTRLEGKISRALNALGYYNSDIRFIAEEDNLIVNVNPGPPMIVTRLGLKLTGDAESDPDFTKLFQESGLKEGIRLNHADYDSFKSKLQTLALEKGYFSAKFILSSIEVSPSTNQATITLHYNSGRRYRFGETTLHGSQIDADRVLSMQAFKTSEPYRMSMVSDFSQSLSSSNWFASVLVEPDFSSLDQETQLPVSVTVTPQSKNLLETGLGYSTDVGIRGSLTWTKPWLNTQGHSFSSDFSLSYPEQSISAGYKIPLDDALHEFYQVQYGLQQVDNLDTKSLASNLSLERHWLQNKGWNKTLFIRYLVENYEQGVLDDVGHFVLPGGTLSRTRVRTGQHQLITWGDEQTVTLEYGNETLFSETDLLRLQAGTSWIRSDGNQHRGILRLAGGANLAGDFARVPPSLRFFAGGDNSIRGYDYESISPRDSSGALTGAKYLATASLEYQYRIYGKWWGAVFYDYGDAFNDRPRWKQGAGVGIRWISPLGPLRLDFAWGLDANPGNQFKIHVTLGPEL